MYIYIYIYIGREEGEDSQLADVPDGLAAPSTIPALVWALIVTFLGGIELFGYSEINQVKSDQGQLRRQLTRPPVRGHGPGPDRG